MAVIIQSWILCIWGIYKHVDVSDCVRSATYFWLVDYITWSSAIWLIFENMFQEISSRFDIAFDIAK